jgi:hypothetical protein
MIFNVTYEVCLLILIKNLRRAIIKFLELDVTYICIVRGPALIDEREKFYNIFFYWH